MLALNMMKALSGDAIHLRYSSGDNVFTNILIDSGTRGCAVKISSLMEEISRRNEIIDLLIITHSDDDHIGGILKLIEENRISYKLLNRVWINDGDYVEVNRGGLYTPKSARHLIDKLNENEVTIESDIKTGIEWERNGGKIIVLSPTESDLELMKKAWKIELEKSNYDELFSSIDEDAKDISELIEENNYISDDSPYNNASITIMFEYEGRKYAFLGDASSASILKGFVQLENYLGQDDVNVDFIKLPHHGSHKNTNSELLTTFKCTNYLISTNGSRGKPHKKTIARLLKSASGERINLFLNYDWWTGTNKFSIDDQEKYICAGLLNRILLDDEGYEYSDMVRLRNV